jgi:hypothetical protein
MGAVKKRLECSGCTEVPARLCELDSCSMRMDVASCACGAGAVNRSEARVWLLGNSLEHSATRSHASPAICGRAPLHSSRARDAARLLRSLM